jgi:hypothetical protein
MKAACVLEFGPPIVIRPKRSHWRIHFLIVGAVIPEKWAAIQIFMSGSCSERAEHSVAD